MAKQAEAWVDGKLRGGVVQGKYFYYLGAKHGSGGVVTKNKMLLTEVRGLKVLDRRSK